MNIVFSECQKYIVILADPNQTIHFCLANGFSESTVK